MKILMVLERDFPPDLRVENEIKSLIKQGHKVCLAGFTFGKKEVRLNWNECQVIKRPISKLVFRSSVGALKVPLYFSFWKSFIQDILKEFVPDAIHIHDLPLASVGVWCRKKTGCKFVLDLHENWPAFVKISKHTNTFLGRKLSSVDQWRRYEKKMCELADEVIVVIDEAAGRLKELGIAPEKTYVVANYPVKEDFIGLEESSDSRNEKSVFFYAGGIGKHRGLQYVIEGLAELVINYPNIELWILGQGNYRDELELLVSKLNLTHVVTFFGQVSYSVVLEKLVQSDIALVPHERSEHTDTTIPHKIFQYMYAQKVVLTSDCIPLKRIIVDSDAGYAYTYNNPGEFAEAAEKIIKSRELAIKLGNNGKKAVKEKYNWDQEAEKLFKIYMQ